MSDHPRKLAAKLAAVASTIAFAGLAITALPVTPAILSAASGQTILQAQAPSEISLNFKYDVISIKPMGPTAHPGNFGFLFDMTPDGIRIGRATLMSLIMIAYGPNAPIGRGFSKDEVIGAPAWVASEDYEINAKMDASVMDALNKLSPDGQRTARQQMLRAILADRFKVAAHVEPRELPVFFLVIAKGGPKFKKATPGEKYPGTLTGADGPKSTAGLIAMLPASNGSRRIISNGGPFELLAAYLSGPSGRYVLDKTGLAGNFDFQLQWTPDTMSASDGSAPAESSFPSLFTALQEQLGLKLEAGKGPVPVLVIDHVEKPAQN